MYILCSNTLEHQITNASLLLYLFMATMSVHFVHKSRVMDKTIAKDKMISVLLKLACL